MIVKGVYGDFKKITGRIRVEEVYGPVDLDRKRIVEEAGLKYVPLIWVPRAGGAEEGGGRIREIHGVGVGGRVYGQNGFAGQGQRVHQRPIMAHPSTDRKSVV